MRAIQRYLPKPRHVEVNRIYVRASPENAWETARHFDMGQIHWVRLLFNIRTLPDWLSGKKSTHEDPRIGVDQVAENDKGFHILEEIPGREVVVGAIGQFWHLHIPFMEVAPAEFRDFDTPGWGKVAWAISVEPFGEGSTIGLELRTAATDDAAWEKLHRYYALIGIGSIPIRHACMRHMSAILGKLKLPDEDTTALPGDELLPAAEYHLDHRIEIEAPPALVWSYLMQLGCDRAGWYSIDAIDHGGVPSVDHLVPGWEQRALGDKIDASPAKDGFFEVKAIGQQNHLVIGGETARLGGHFHMTWAFALHPVGADACLLYTRVRIQGAPKWSEWLVSEVIYPPIHGLMQGVQLKRLKALAERDAQAR